MDLEPRRNHWRNEAHVTDAHNGHELDVDCWCEPRSEWRINSHGVRILVVLHNDAMPHHPQRANVVSMRNLTRDYITSLLNSIYFFEHER
jgi:hypothetical protein